MLPTGVKVRDVILSTVVSLGALLLTSFERTNVSWSLGLIVLPVTLLAGFLSAWMYYQKHELTSMDPFYIRAWWAVIGGAITLPVCFLVRPVAAPLSFLTFLFGLGPVIGFHLYRHVAKRRGI